MSSRLRKKVRHSYLEYTEKDIYLPPLKKAESNRGVKQICDRLQENRAQRGPDEKYFFCTYRLRGKQILSSPSFIAVALAIPAIYRLTVPFVRLI